MSYSQLLTPDLSQTAIIALHRLAARCPGDANAAVLEKCLHELSARAVERDKLRLSPRERALQRNIESGVELTRG